MGGIRQSVDAGFSPAKRESDFLPSLGMGVGAEKNTPVGRNQKVADTLPLMPARKNNDIVSKSVLDDDFNLDDF